MVYRQGLGVGSFLSDIRDCGDKIWHRGEKVLEPPYFAMKLKQKQVLGKWATENVAYVGKALQHHKAVQSGPHPEALSIIPCETFPP